MNQEQKIISSVCIHETHDWTVQQSGAQVSQVVRKKMVPRSIGHLNKSFFCLFWDYANSVGTPAHCNFINFFSTN